MWIVVNIGCIECGVSSNIVGVFDSEEKAQEIAEECGEKYSWREGGQNSFDVFPLPEANKINEEYNEIGTEQQLQPDPNNKGGNHAPKMGNGFVP